MEIKKSGLIAGCVLAMAISATSCSAKKETPVVQNEEESGPKLLSTVAMGDTKADSQLLSGFYTVENSWRWTAGKFSALLKTPLGAAQKGATLTFDFSVPDAVLQKLKTVTLTASINGMQLKSETYKASGKYTYTADVPASMLMADTVKIDFALDKSLPPSPSDKRELGVIATSVGVATK